MFSNFKPKSFSLPPSSAVSVSSTPSVITIPDEEITEVETAEHKANRPFLLATEVVNNKTLQTFNRTRANRGKTQGKGKNGSKGNLVSIRTFMVPGHLPFAPRRPDHVFRTVRTLESGSYWSTSASIPTFKATAFVFSDIGDYTSFTALFDQYRIELIEFCMFPNINFWTGATLSAYSTAVDFDDNTAPTTIQEVNDFSNVQVTPSMGGVYVKFVPHAAYATYSGAFTSYGNVTAPWIDMASPSVQHFGVKHASDATSAGVVVYRSVIRYHIACRNCR